MTVTDLYRIAVHAHRAGDRSAADLVLPADVELGELMPGIIDLADGEADSTDVGHRWLLSRLDGTPLDESLTLCENRVNDGDLVLLTTEAAAPAPTLSDIARHVVHASPSPQHTSDWSRRLGRWSWLWSTASGTAVLVWPTHAAQGHRAVAAAIFAVAALISALVANRADVHTATVLLLGTSAVAFGAVAGYLMVPGGPTPPNILLAAAVCCAAATVLLHATACRPTLWMAITSCCAMVAIAAAAATIWSMPSATAGSLLAAASLAMLGGAAKLSILIAGLSPRMPDGAACVDHDANVPATVGIARARLGHDVLTGLLAGFSLAAALGATLVAVDGHGNHWARACLPAAVGTVLTFRACQQRGALRSAPVLFAALLCMTAVSASTLMSSPGHAPWVVGSAVVMGFAALYFTHAARAPQMSPLVRRGAQALDYLALAAVVPVACWTAGVFDLVRAAGLS